MPAIYHKPTRETPEVILDKEKGIFLISGVSLPEDVKEFYIPIINWFKDYFKAPNKKTILTINLVYFNSATSKMFLELFYLFKKENQKGLDVEVVWQYLLDDDEMGEAGEDFAFLMGKLPFRLEGVQPNL